MFISEGLTVYGIANELNQRAVPYTGLSKWDYQAVYSILTHPKYVGCHVYGRTSSRLYTPKVRIPKADWILAEKAFEPMVDQTAFFAAQRIVTARTINKTDEELLDKLRMLLSREGRLSLRLIQNSADMPSPSTYRLRFGSMRQAYQLIGYGRPGQFGPILIKTCRDVPSPSTYRGRFGSLRRAYELIGYGRPDQFGSIDLRRRTQALREELVGRITALFPGEVSIVRRGERWRSRLRLRSGLTVSVLVARSKRVWKETVRWQI
ncbi:MAG: hypothetical protein DMG79_20520, partial [Acidobacteria bacterium]